MFSSVRPSRRAAPGFTLVELLVVIAIIAALATYAVISLVDVRRQARDLKRVEDMRSLWLALELYNDDHHGYPLALDPVVLGTAGYQALCSNGFQAACPQGDQFFQHDIPQAVRPFDGDCTEDTNDYRYQTPHNGEFRIDFCLGGKVGELKGGLHNVTPSGIQ